MSATFTDLLPPTKSEPNGAAFDWTPTDSDGPTAGVLTIKSKRVYTSYVVCEFPTGWDGRGFHLAKITPGSDSTEERYNCFLAKSGTHRECECKGYQFTGGCKHLSALAALIDAGRI